MFVLCGHVLVLEIVSMATLCMVLEVVHVTSFIITMVTFVKWHLMRQRDVRMEGYTLKISVDVG